MGRWLTFLPGWEDVRKCGVPENGAAFGSGFAAAAASLGEIGNPREEKKQADHEKEKQSGKSRSGVARTARLAAEGWRGARALHGRDRGLSRSETRSVRRRVAAHGMQVKDDRRVGPWGDSGFKPKPKQAYPWI